MEKEVDIEEIKRTLKDAGMYDAALTTDELRSYYSVLKDSENTANQEEESRKLYQTLDSQSSNTVEDSNENDSQTETTSLTKEKKGFVPKSWSSLKNSIINEKTHNEIIDALEDNEKPKDATKNIFGFNEMFESLEKNTCHIMKNDLKFIPIQSTMRFLRADLKTKARILYAYHTKIHAFKDQLARQCFLSAPTPKAIVNINHYAISTENIDDAETYVSRSGRQTKRKIYCDENSLDDDFETASNKKTKNSEVDWLDKTMTKKSENKAKTADKQMECHKEQPEIDKNINMANLDNNNQMESIDQKEEIVVKEIPKTEVAEAEIKSKSTTKSFSSKKLSNSDIMKRSKLFKDTPKKGARAELLFDKLIEETEKKQKEEKTMSDFEKTLEQIDDDEECAKSEKTGSDNEDIIDVEIVEPKRRRVIPPIPGRRPINKRSDNTKCITPLSVIIETLPSKLKENSSFSQDTEDSVGASPSKKRNTNRKTTRPAASKKNSASTSLNNLQPCPICDVSFPKDKILEHAATCGDQSEVVTRSTSNSSKISCEICDAVIPLSTEYEVHVKECIKLQRSGRNK